MKTNNFDIRSLFDPETFDFSLRTLTFCFRAILQKSDFIICYCFLPKYRAVSKILLQLLIKFLTSSWPDKHIKHCTNETLIAFTNKTESQRPVNKRLKNNAVK
jgi:hypothetical protein